MFVLLPLHHNIRATFTRSWREFTSVTVVESSTGTWNPRTSWSTIRELLNWLISAWLVLLVFLSGSTHTRWESVHTTLIRGRWSSTLSERCITAYLIMLTNKCLQTDHWNYWTCVCVVFVGRYSLVPGSRGPPWFTPIFNPCWCLEHWDHLCWTCHQEASVPWRLGDRPAL